jgi:hypothetical protein
MAGEIAGPIYSKRGGRTPVVTAPYAVVKKGWFPEKISPAFATTAVSVPTSLPIDETGRSDGAVSFSACQFANHGLALRSLERDSRRRELRPRIGDLIRRGESRRGYFQPR